MFELEKAIVNWKDALSGDGIIQSKEQLELESHLRESIDTLLTQGLSSQEAFLVAANRLGRPAKLKQEYLKNDPACRWRYRVFWMLAGFLGLKAIGNIVSSITAMAGTALAVSGLAGSVCGVTTVALTFTLWLCVLLIAYRKRQDIGRSGESMPSALIVAVGAVLVLGPAVITSLRILQTNLVPSSWYGETAFYSSIGGAVLNLCIISFCFVVMWMLNDREAMKVDKIAA